MWKETYPKKSTILRQGDKIPLVYWHIIYQTPSSELSAFDRTAHRREDDGHGSRSGPCSSPRQRYLPLDAIGYRGRRDGDDRELPIWLDVLRPRHSEKIRLGSRLDPVGVHALRSVRNLAGA